MYVLPIELNVKLSAAGEDTPEVGKTSSDSDIASSPPKVPLAVARPRPRAMPAVKKAAVQAVTDPSSSPAQSSSSNPAKRGRPAFFNNDDENDADLGPNLDPAHFTATGGSTDRKGRLIVESDDDE